jgi:chemotaxis protein methyltransferase CheR
VSDALAFLVSLTGGEFEVFRALVRARTGIALTPQKRLLLQSRLAKRLRALGLATFTEYHEHLTLRDPHGEEMVHFVNAVTTNKTEFFREPHHFDYLREQWAPLKRRRTRRAGDRVLRFWSAACSTGEEAYSLAMTLLEALGEPGHGWDLRILASDIDTDVLAHAAAGTYGLEQVAPIAPALRARYLLRGRGASAGLARVRPVLRELTVFRRISLLDEPWPIRTRFDAIFCRNALIYFDRPTQARILERLVGFLKDDGLLILGHSETVHGLGLDLAPVGNTIYRCSHG